MSMQRIVPGLIALLSATCALAANRLQFGPPPAWVKPVALPGAGKATQAALKILLVDHQIDLSPNTVSYYVESVTRIQTPQGLNALGTLTFVWDPDTDVLIIHKIHIIRGAKVINVLASGQKFTIAKRETNLAYATLDDTLTAILQPAGLRVGDVLDVAYTLERTDPVLAGHPAAQIEVPPNIPVTELHVRALWPTSEPIRWHATRGLDGVHAFHHGETSGISLTMRHVQPILEPKGAPLRYLVDRRIDFTSFRSWAQLAGLFAPLYNKAAQLPPHSPLRAQIARIRAATDDPTRRAALALRLVEEKVRYLFLDLNQGGLVPAAADLTWSRRFGDCKAKTVLLLALLRGLKIDAQPVLVNVLTGSGLNDRLPMMWFDHALVRAVIAGKTYWLDGTRLGDRSLAHLHTPYDHWGLPLAAQGAHLIAMVPRPPGRALVSTRIHIDASAGVAEPVPFHVESTLRGDLGLLTKARLANLTPTQLQTALRRYWSTQYEFVHIKSVSAAYGEHAHAELLRMDGTAKMDWSDGQYETDVLGMGYHADFERQPGPNRNAPYAVLYPTFKRTVETISLPEHGKGFTLSGADIDRTVAGMHYERHANINNGLFWANSSWRSVATEFPAGEAAQDQAVLRKLNRSKLYIDAPTGHVPTAAEIGWGAAKQNDSAKSFAKSAYILLTHFEVDAAEADANAALEFDSNNSDALVMQGLIYLFKGHSKRAAAEFAAALASDPHNPWAYAAQGQLAYDADDNRGAVKALSSVLRLDSKNVPALFYRAYAYLRMDRLNKALADLATISRLRPHDARLALDLSWMRAFVFRRQGKTTEAVAQAKDLEAAYPKSPGAFFTAARIYGSLHQTVRARTAFHRGLALRRTAMTHLDRAAYRPWSDLPGRRRDIEAALKAHPASPSILFQLAQVQEAGGDNDAAIDSLSRALHGIRDAEAVVSVPMQLKTLVPSLLALRASAYEKTGRKRLERHDLAAARRAATDPMELNNLCWRLATAGLSLRGALSDCNAAIAKQPYVAPFLDSRGFVLMKLGHYHRAIASYDSALRLQPEQADSLYGLGICELRTGHTRTADADIRLAEFLSFEVRDQFAHYGIRP